MIRRRRCGSFLRLSVHAPLLHDAFPFAPDRDGLPGRDLRQVIDSSGRSADAVRLRPPPALPDPKVGASSLSRKVTRSRCATSPSFALPPAFTVTAVPIPSRLERVPTSLDTLWFVTPSLRKRTAGPPFVIISTSRSPVDVGIGCERPTLGTPRSGPTESVASTNFPPP